QTENMNKRILSHLSKSLKGIGLAVESQTGVTVSRDNIRHTLQRNGMHGYRPRRKHLLAHLGLARHCNLRPLKTTNIKKLGFQNYAAWGTQTYM
uniref:Transposase Tc1-like domain-containing protein n=1 Tax=Nothobranchius furzeri TaxID=105023 RepID=A0A8C6NN89_NOTFU